ncbi:YozE family protein [Gleimia hominis]|uniref:YozE family protein n=1 Tax=Gleimia hominis TaxID=595468 RepID=A0ABU3ICU3_9ACTO|nr:YozE family protein [Gleimia hominis]MDT3768195.1 YozE family protein [Gleimia hominis]
MNFYEWVTQHYYNQDTPEGDLAGDMAWDDYAGANTKEAILTHLHRCGACDDCIGVFNRCWRRYQNAPDRDEPTSMPAIPVLTPPKPLIGRWQDSQPGQGFLDLNHDDQQFLLEWIATRLTPSEQWNRKRSSYGIKHAFTRDTGIYITNAQFKDAMILAGYAPKNQVALNHVYQISEYSQAFSYKPCIATSYWLPGECGQD